MNTTSLRLLHLDSSITGENSVSRLLTAEVVAAEQHLHPQLSVTYRDLAAQPLAHLSAGHLAGSPETAAERAAGAAALEEFLAADIVVIGAPMYNFGIPSQLKAWFDRVAVAGKTFEYTSSGPRGLAGNKRVIVVSSRGGAYAQTPLEVLDHQESYLRAVLGFLGITDITFVRAENTSRAALRAASLAAARSQIAQLAA
ncbi:NAD(P)H-dependent oxidoreductase [Opitutus sp. ER46]|uniref:FMN-dependent NADH-azoreductase n=1 Tax=Opitutus sp. ER46 TaxID=2161864 RepID=UPI000D31A36B|nr:NAD(P)H-dependent oxidoreductase [Opitutus sp. ER46]PTX96597.1 FMN-dependent NADH-azoreductase [Opitutus sp. ER46]